MRFSEKIKKMFIWITKVVIAGTCAVIVLSIFCIVYSYDGIHITNTAGSTDYVWEEKQLKSNMKEGFAWLKMDSHGFNNMNDYYKEPDILLIGSSNVEALQVDSDENIGALLNRMMPEYKTYNIGMSGHTIYRCVDNLDHALQTHNPQKYIVMVTDSVDLSIEEMQKVIAQEAEAIPSYDSGLVYHLQKNPAVKVIYKQISDWIVTKGGNSEDEVRDSKQEISKESYNNVLRQFLKSASEVTKNANIPLILVYQPSQIIEEDGTIAFKHSDENVKIFKEECLKQGIIFHDMSKEFRVLYEEQNIIAHGFSNTEVGSGHLNKYGHELIAEAINSEIRKLEAK